MDINFNLTQKTMKMATNNRNIEIYDKETNSLIRIVYNPFCKSKKEILDFWIPAEYRNRVYARYFTKL